MPTVKVFVFHGQFWPRLLLLATSGMNTNYESYVCELRFWVTSGLPLCQTRVRVRWRQSLAPHCASRSLRSGRQLLAWDCKYEYTRTPVGKRWHESTSISFPGMERVKTESIATHNFFLLRQSFPCPCVNGTNSPVFHFWLLSRILYFLDFDYRVMSHSLYFKWLRTNAFHHPREARLLANRNAFTQRKYLHARHSVYGEPV